MPPRPPLSCSAVAGLDRLLKPGTVVLLGEMHGTNECPGFVANAACLALKSGDRVTVGLEIPSAEGKRFAAYLRSKGTEKDRAALLAGPFWSDPAAQDGRASRAMLSLVESLRQRKADGYPVRVKLLDRKAKDRDRVMAERLRAAIEAAPADLFLVLTGNVHTRTLPGSPWDPHRQNMGALLVKRLPKKKIVALDLSHNGGMGWLCIPTMADCGIHTQDAVRPGDEPRVSVYAKGVDLSGFHGFYHVGFLTPSLPAAVPVDKDSKIRKVPGG
ncbi:MAG TPA: hypothetical protein VOA87_22635 [Thermoanaerobaculia bacterium]|nr:hypothetical protein [Thermoanaerobaculia bacterium]